MDSGSRTPVFQSGEYRTCYVDDQKALFHRWVERAQTVGESPFVGGPAAGQVKYAVAIVEFENGEVKEVSPCEIRFACNDKFGSKIWFGDKGK